MTNNGIDTTFIFKRNRNSINTYEAVLDCALGDNKHSVSPTAGVEPDDTRVVVTLQSASPLNSQFIRLAEPLFIFSIPTRCDNLSQIAAPSPHLDEKERILANWIRSIMGVLFEEEYHSKLQRKLIGRRDRVITERQYRRALKAREVSFAVEENYSQYKNSLVRYELQFLSSSLIGFEEGRFPMNLPLLSVFLSFSFVDYDYYMSRRLCFRIPF
jgi:hypothetical protein